MVALDDDTVDALVAWRTYVGALTGDDQLSNKRTEAALQREVADPSDASPVADPRVMPPANRNGTNTG
jgi:hypothetical protein